MVKRRTAMTFGEQMRRIYHLYVTSGGTLPVRLDDLYDFAKRQCPPLWMPQPSDERKQFRQQMAQALRGDEFTDDKGRTVRRTLPVMISGYDENGNKKKVSLWDDIDTAPRNHVEASLSLRRKQIVGDCKQLKNDADHRNDMHPTEPPIILLLDFTRDVEESELPDVYDPGVDDDDTEPDILV